MACVHGLILFQGNSASRGKVCPFWPWTVRYLSRSGLTVSVAVCEASNKRSDSRNQPASWHFKTSPFSLGYLGLSVAQHVFVIRHRVHVLAWFARPWAGISRGWRTFGSSAAPQAQAAQNFFCAFCAFLRPLNPLKRLTIPRISVNLCAVNHRCGAVGDWPVKPFRWSASNPQFAGPFSMRDG